MIQELLDIKEMLPTLEAILTEETKKTTQLSQQLVDIGETSLATTQTTKGIEEQLKTDGERLDNYIQGQQQVIDSLTGLLNRFDTEDSATEELTKLKDEFVQKLDSIVSLHAADKEAIVAKIAEVYVDYTSQVEQLSTSINKLTTLLEDPSYQNRVEQLARELGAFKTHLTELQNSYEEKANEQSNRVNQLLESLVQTSTEYQTLIEETTNSRQLVSKVATRMQLIEDRLDALLAISTGNAEGSEA